MCYAPGGRPVRRDEWARAVGGLDGVDGSVALRAGMREEHRRCSDLVEPSSCLQPARGGGGGMTFRAAAVGVVLVLAAAAAPDGSRVLAQLGGADLRFAVPVRGMDAPDSPVLARHSYSSIGRRAGPAGYEFRNNAPVPGYSGVLRFRVELFDAGDYELRPNVSPGTTVRQQIENELVMLVTRLNSAGDGMFSQTQDTFVVEPINWGSARWASGPDSSRGARVQAALGNAADRTQWYAIAVDRTVPGVDIDESAQRFLYVPPPPVSPLPPVPPLPSRVTGVRVSPVDGGLHVSWSAAAGEVSQYRVDAADASGELARRVYTDADVHEAVVDRLVNGAEYTVTVTALTSRPDVEGPASETVTAAPRAGGGDTEDVPVPALPLAGAGVLAGLLASAAYRLRRTGRRTHPCRRRSG